MMKIFAFICIFLSLALANNDFTPLEKCTYENENFWIKILYLCPEGDLACDKMIYVGVNKNDGSYIALKGKILLDENSDFKGYVFENKNYQYRILRNDFLYIFKDAKMIKEIKLDICNN